MTILDKIWYLGGWFYLGLVIVVVASIVGPRRLRGFLTTGVIIATLLTSVYYISINYKNILSGWVDIRTEYSIRFDKGSFGQYTFSQKINEIVPLETNGCVLWAWDGPTQYLLQHLYPRSFKYINSGSDLCQCPVLITQFHPLENPSFTLWLGADNNYVYRRI